MKQLSFFPPPNREHGGTLSIGKRRSRRVLSTRESLHVTLRSEFATGPRSLLNHRDIILATLKKAEALYRIKVYSFAINRNHLHLSLRGKSRIEIQNFFRVFAGHTAQLILARCPYSKDEEMKLEASQTGCLKNRRRFWALLIYTRLVTWGREFAQVTAYLVQNTLEALNIIAYRPRKKARAGPA